jgi:hypothetical protein
MLRAPQARLPLRGLVQRPFWQARSRVVSEFVFGPSASISQAIAKKLYCKSAMNWSVESLNEVVDAELEELPADRLARFHYVAQLIEEFGLERAKEIVK